MERGPLVYCAEWADNNGDIDKAAIDRKEPVKVLPDYEIRNTEGDGKAFKVMALKHNGLTLIPYYSWNHRGAGKMDVWIKNKE